MILGNGIGYNSGMFKGTNGRITHDFEVPVQRLDLGIGNTKVGDLMGMNDVVVHVVIGIGGVKPQGIVFRQ